MCRTDFSNIPSRLHSEMNYCTGKLELNRPSRLNLLPRYLEIFQCLTLKLSIHITRNIVDTMSDVRQRYINEINLSTVFWELRDLSKKV